MHDTGRVFPFPYEDCHGGEAAEARLIVDDSERRLPDHPGTQYLREIQNLEDGRVGRALRGFKRLLESFRNRLQFAFGLSAPAVLWVTPPYCARHFVQCSAAG